MRSGPFRSLLFSIILVTGALAAASIEAQQPTATATPAAAAGERAAPEGERRRARRGAEFDTTELALGSGEKIELRFDQPTTEDAAYAAIQTPVDGQVVTFIKSRPLKLKTPVDLHFGDVVVAAHNQVPDYPGVYSLWLKNVGGQWRLVFNDLADVWGTQHDANADKAEVPLFTTATAPAATFTAKLEPAAGGGILRLAWGSTEWSVPFTVE